jgi:CHRD domain
MTRRTIASAILTIVLPIGLTIVLPIGMGAALSVPIPRTVMALAVPPAVGGAASAQQGATAPRGDTFNGRLSPLPVTPLTAPTTTGSGSFTAVMQGNKLTVTGTFEGMNSPATEASVRRAPKGLRGPVVWTLNVTKGTRGTLDGTLTLTAVQVEDLRKGWYYIQIQTPANPDGQLRGWILK